jgi:transaldolase
LSPVCVGCPWATSCKVAGLENKEGEVMKDDPLRELETLGQSIWLDYIGRDLMASGGLRRLIEEDGLRGMTSNPAIFEKAIAESHDYDEDVRVMALQGRDAEAVYEDPQPARRAERCRRVPASLRQHRRQGCGYVSLEATVGTGNQHRRRGAAT